MGFDVTYHPVTPEEMHSLYFMVREQSGAEDTLIRDYQLDELNGDKLRHLFTLAREASIDGDPPFASEQGFFLAVALGLLRPYHYIRGGAFSFLVEDEPRFTAYTADWHDLIPASWPVQELPRGFSENYCVGVYLPLEQLRRLRQNAAENPEIHASLSKVFGEGALEVFWQAVDDAIAQNRGLLEATDIIEPNPVNPEESAGYANIDLCHPEGLQRYFDTAQRQLDKALGTRGIEGKIDRETITVTPEPDKKPD